MIEAVQHHVLRCSTCTRAVTLTTPAGSRAEPELPGHWKAEGAGKHVCPRCRAARGDFGVEAQRNVAAVNRVKVTGQRR